MFLPTSLQFLLLHKMHHESYFFDSSKETFLNSFKAFSNSKDALRARVPAALFPFSICRSASVIIESYNSLIFATISFIILFSF